MEQFQNILLSYRLRGKAPNQTGLIGKIHYLIYQVKIIILSFYPLMLNTAKCARTTVEALELKGYRYAIENPKVKKMKLSRLKFTNKDAVFACISMAYVAVSLYITSNH